MTSAGGVVVVVVMEISSAGGGLVVVSAGAFGSPAILQRSGIGARTLLKRLDINEQVDLPGVGENYQGTQRT